ncbi:response regulator [Amycolatopsis thermoflava]|uniref:response regulator n=1 Tax=Amycolatopsis thermoflava TaxID=84480 RepID=UPI000683E723|nr:response regulator transcription factor [Amycolatopsis thermoflava]
MTASRLRVLVVLPQPLLRYGVRSLIGQLNGVGEVVEAVSEQEALRHCSQQLPGLIITDLMLPSGGTGLRVCRFVKERRPDVPVIVLSADAAPAAIAAALNAGADSFLLKSASCDEVLEAVAATCSGRRAWVLGDAVPRTAEFSRLPGADLTNREQEVLSLLLKRRSNEEIAEELCLAQQTVKNYVSKVLQKLGFGSRRELFRSVESRVDRVPRPRTRSTDFPETRPSSLAS